MPIPWSALTCTPPFEALHALGESWGWLVGEPFEPILFSALGDVFLTRGSGVVWWLNTGTGELTVVAASVAEFQTLLSTEKVNEWLLPELVAKLHAAGKILGPGECFTFITLPVFSQGRYEVTNMNPVPLREHFGFTGRIIRETEGHPDGAQVRVKFN
jgi:hypothetical protein